MIAIDNDLLERIAAERRFEARTLDMARRLFIHHETPKRVASEFGVNTQRIYAIRKEILAAAEAYQLPDGWMRAELVGPTELVEHYRQLFEAALAKQQRRAVLA